MITAKELEPLRDVLERLPLAINAVRRVVRQQRLALDMSVRCMADELGVPPTTLARFENGVGMPHVDTLLTIYRRLSELLEHEGGES